MVLFLPLVVLLLTPGAMIFQPIALVMEYTNWWACFAAILALSYAIANMLLICCGPAFDPTACTKAMVQVGIAEAAVTAACQ